MVEKKNNHTAAQRWWRNLPDELALEQGQAGLESFARGQDDQCREEATGSTTAAAMFGAQRLRPLPPTVFSVIVSEERTATGRH